MATSKKAEIINRTQDAWESGRLGRDKKYAVAASKEHGDEIDDALGLQMISIRLDKELIDAFKLLGAKYQMGYQPLMREALKRFVDGELKMVALEVLEKQSLARSRKKDDVNHPKRVKIVKAA